MQINVDTSGEGNIVREEGDYGFTVEPRIIAVEPLGGRKKPRPSNKSKPSSHMPTLTTSLTEHQLLLLGPTIQAFTLKTKQWCKYAQLLFATDTNQSMRSSDIEVQRHSRDRTI